MRVSAVVRATFPDVADTVTVYWPAGMPLGFPFDTSCGGLGPPPQARAEITQQTENTSAIRFSRCRDDGALPHRHPNTTVAANPMTRVRPANVERDVVEIVSLTGIEFPLTVAELGLKVQLAPLLGSPLEQVSETSPANPRSPSTLRS